MEKLIYELIAYGIQNGLIEADDVAYRINVLAEMLGVMSFNTSYEDFCNDRNTIRPVNEILDDICDVAYRDGILKENGITYRDLFDTKVMGAITPTPSTVIREFKTCYKESSKKATDYYYDFSRATNYIRTDRIRKDEKWQTETEYGAIDISINLSKPEKDPKAIAAALSAPKGGYPACLLCRENEGYAGHLNHPARQNHRLIPITLDGEDYFLQYSPYVYYNEHCIVLNKEHIPMKIDRAVFTKLFDFIDLFPHYIIGSNADLPIVGGSILSHDHFQGGNYIFPMARAEYEEIFELKEYPDIKAGIIKWPMSVIRLQGKDRKKIEEASDMILNKWRAYSDESVGIFAKSVKEGSVEEPHNTITPIARMKDGLYEIDLVLRNNRTDEEHPWGIFHPTADLHHIKKENIGLIEVMGLAILPARLLHEMSEVERRILLGLNRGKTPDTDLRADEITAKHADWVESWISDYDSIHMGNLHSIIQNEIGKVFTKVLECAGVYKRDEEGRKAFRRFCNTL